MVAIVTSEGLGLFNSSARILGGAGLLGQSAFGQAGGQSYVNAANGNLIVQFADEVLSGVGGDVRQVRTYNSLGEVVGGLGRGWSWLGESRVELLGEVGEEGSAVRRTDGDGSVTVYAW